jgi:SAM-dependent methyltransferase
MVTRLIATIKNRISPGEGRGPIPAVPAAPPAETLPPAVASLETDPLVLQAVELNKALFATVAEIPPAEWNEVTARIESLCQKRGYTPDYTANWLGHRYRLYLTILWLGKIISAGPPAPTVYDLGSESLSTELMRDYFPQARLQNTEGDLRYPWSVLEESADILVCTELLEHLSDIPEGISDGFFKTGLKAVLGQCFRALKPGGALLATTPNAGSIIHLETALVGAPPWFFGLHVREYTLAELNSELKEAGFEVEQSQSMHCLTIDYQKDYRRVYQMLLQFGYTTAERGDDLFIVARKPYRQASPEEKQTSSNQARPEDDRLM